MQLQFLRLSCSLDTFYRLFVANKAPFSFDRYQRDQIRDRDVSITPWIDDDDGDESLYDSAISVCSRTLTFTHPIKTGMGMGPSEARTKRRQLLRRYQQYGMTVENKTVVEGIPAADTFSVHDFWKIEADGTEHVVVSVNFAPRFTKRTLFKGIIEKSILRESKEWFTGYTKMVKEALSSGDEAVPEPKAVVPPQPGIDEAFPLILQKWLCSLYPLVILGLILLLLVLGVLALQLVYMHEAVSILRDETTILLLENRRIVRELDRAFKCSASEFTVQFDDALP
jgi:VAD1 Analog of StAR-related lipid transfer domain